MIRTLLQEGSTQTEGGAELISRWQNNPNAFIWVDLSNEDTESEKRLLIETFGLHPLAISDAQRTRHPAKVEAFADYTFLLLKGLTANTTDMNFGTLQIAMFLGQRFFVTRHSDVSVSIDKLWQETASKQTLAERVADGLAVQLSRFVVDRYLPILLELEQRLDTIEEEMFERPADNLLNELVGHKTGLKKLRRIMAYHTQLFQRLKTEQWPAIEGEHKHEINDVYEQLERATSLATLYHELATDLQDGYISLASHKLNNIVKILTIITVIFVPLSFLAGIYGMNFEFIPELKFRYGYFILLSVMACLVAGLLLAFRRIKWL